MRVGLQSFIVVVMAKTTLPTLCRQNPKLSNISMECKSSVLTPIEAFGGEIGLWRMESR